MFTKTLTLLNMFLFVIEFNGDYFQENDFEPVEHDYKGQYIIATKQQWITYKGYTFRVYIYCEIETQLDELSKIYFISNDINDNNQEIILEYLTDISIMFSGLMTPTLYLALDSQLIYETYKKTLSELKNRKPQLNSDKVSGIGVINILLPEDIDYLKYRTFFGLLINKENEIIINYTIDLYNQYYN
ncbi:MAG: hypothetical protein LUG60_07055 [Erysipelotrichaceae bacterium]|nr:hypothetical protein [Erysipelotrichaceae bacterium]